MLRAEVSLLEALGSEIMVHFRLDASTVDSGDPDAVEEAGTTANAVGRFHPRSRVKVGDQAEIAVSTENLHFFDPEYAARHLGLRPPRQLRGGPVVKRSTSRITAL